MRLSTQALPAAAIAAALAFVGCGGGDDDSTTTATGTAPKTTQKNAGSGNGKKAAKQGRATKQNGEERKQGGSGDQSAATVPPFQAPSGSAPTTSASLPNEGTRRVAPGVPTRKYTDSSVQRFGLEGPVDDRIEAARLLQAFLNARTDGDWPLACSYLSEPIKKQMQALAAQGQREDLSLDAACIQIMKAFGQGVPKGQLRTAADIEVISMRIRGDTAIVIYRDGNGTASTIPMNREGGNWKVSAAAGSVLFLGA